MAMLLACAHGMEPMQMRWQPHVIQAANQAHLAALLAARNSGTWPTTSARTMLTKCFVTASTSSTLLAPLTSRL